jgi:hypothetical protein
MNPYMEFNSEGLVDAKEVCEIFHLQTKAWFSILNTGNKLLKWKREMNIEKIDSHEFFYHHEPNLSDNNRKYWDHYCHTIKIKSKKRWHLSYELVWLLMWIVGNMMNSRK